MGGLITFGLAIIIHGLIDGMAIGVFNEPALVT
jgi:zinc transporter ZupT